MMTAHVTVNGEPVTIPAGPDRRLVDVLRDDLGLTGTKVGCGVGVCGLCSVLVDGALVSGCLTPAFVVDGAAVETVEGLAPASGELTRLQEEFIVRGAFQCGICTPGQLMAATALLRENPHPTDAEIDQWFSGNLCRCTGYEGIRAAVRATVGPP